MDLLEQLSDTQVKAFKKLTQMSEEMAERAICSVMRYALMRQWTGKPMCFADVKTDVLEKISKSKTLPDAARAVFAEACSNSRASASTLSSRGLTSSSPMWRPRLGARGAKAAKQKQKQKKGRAAGKALSSLSRRGRPATGPRSDVWYLTSCLRDDWQCARTGRAPNAEAEARQAERGFLMAVLAVLWVNGGSAEQGELWRAIEPLEEDALKAVTAAAEGRPRGPGADASGARRRQKPRGKAFRARKWPRRTRDGHDDEGKPAWRYSKQRAAAEVRLHDVHAFIRQTDERGGVKSDKGTSFEEFVEWLRAQNGEVDADLDSAEARQRTSSPPHERCVDDAARAPLSRCPLSLWLDNGGRRLRGRPTQEESRKQKKMLLSGCCSRHSVSFNDAFISFEACEGRVCGGNLRRRPSAPGRGASAIRRLRRCRRPAWLIFTLTFLLLPPTRKRFLAWRLWTLSCGKGGAAKQRAAVAADQPAAAEESQAGEETVHLR